MEVVLTLVRGTDKINEKVKSAGTVGGRMDKTIDHALRIAVESSFASKWNPRDCFLGTIWGLGFEKGDDVAKIGMELDEWEIGGEPALGDDPRSYF